MELTSLRSRTHGEPAGEKTDISVKSQPITLSAVECVVLLVILYA